MTIQRWQPMDGTMLEAKAVGWFVRHDDHLAAITEKDAALQREREVRKKLVEALEDCASALHLHRKEWYANPICGWDFASTIAKIDAALAAAKESA